MCRVEENKFESWEAAERFFTESGFRVERRLVPPCEPRAVRQSWVLVAEGR